MGQGRPGRGKRGAPPAHALWQRAEAHRGLWGAGGAGESRRRAAAAQRCAEGPCAPAEVEAWPDRGATGAADPKGADFVLLSFLGKLLSWLRRGGQAG